MALLKKRRIEITAVERVSIRLAQSRCPVCQGLTEWLTTAQAAALLQITPLTIYRWLAQGKAHGVKTAGGQHRLCRHSLWLASAHSKEKS